MSSTPEGKVKAAVKTWWKRVRGWFYMPVQTGMGVVGIPDFVGCIPIVITQEMVGKRVGLFVAVECKAPGKLGNVTANQQFQIDAIHTAGGYAVVVDDAKQLEGLEDELFPIPSTHDGVEVLDHKRSPGCSHSRRLGGHRGRVLGLRVSSGKVCGRYLNGRRSR